MNGRPRRWLGALVLMAMVAGLLVSAQGRAVAQEASSGRIIEDEDPPYGRDLQNYITWNLWQNDHWNNPSNFYVPTNRLWYRIRDSRRLPRAVATQEICQPAFLDLRNKLADLGYSAVFHPTDPGDPDEPPCLVHGVAIYWRGGCYGGANQCRDDGTYLPQGPGDSDAERGWACGRSLTYDAFYCSTHLTSDQEPAPDTRYWARQQSNAYRNKSETVRAQVGIPTVFMGDFNIDYRDYNPGFQPWRDHHKEADACDGAVNPDSDCFNTFSISDGQQRNKKLDYIFASKGPGHCFRADDPSFYFGPYSGSGGPVISDHVLVRGYFGCP